VFFDIESINQILVILLPCIGAIYGLDIPPATQPSDFESVIMYDIPMFAHRSDIVCWYARHINLFADCC